MEFRVLAAARRGVGRFRSANARALLVVLASFAVLASSAASCHTGASGCKSDADCQPVECNEGQVPGQCGVANVCEEDPEVVCKGSGGAGGGGGAGGEGGAGGTGTSSTSGGGPCTDDTDCASENCMPPTPNAVCQDGQCICGSDCVNGTCKDVLMQCINGICNGATMELSALNNCITFPGTKCESACTNFFGADGCKPMGACATCISQNCPTAVTDCQAH